MIAGHALGEAIGVGDFVGELYLEAVVVEAGGIFFLHLRELQVVGGDDARDGERRDGLEEQARAFEFVERVGAF